LAREKPFLKRVGYGSADVIAEQTITPQPEISRLEMLNLVGVLGAQI
jgi:hypothetical protein